MRDLSSENEKGVSAQFGFMSPVFYHVDIPHINSGSLPKFKEHLASMVKQEDRKEVVLNMEGVENIVAVGWHAIMKVKKELEPSDRKIVILDPKGQVLESLEFLGFTELIEVHQTEAI